MRDFKGKIVFVTGGASGAGLGQAKVFGREGMKVCIADVRQDALDNAVKELNDLAELSETGLPAGPYTVFVTLLNAAGEEITQYSFPYTIAE